MYGRDAKADAKYVPSDYYERNFNTPLDSRKRAAYLVWLANNGRSQDTQDYDVSGYFNKYGGSNDAHLTDEFKKPNHPSFGDESVYSGTPNEFTGNRYIGGKWTDGQYAPSVEMLKTTHDPRVMLRYFQRNEPGVRVRMP